MTDRRARSSTDSVRGIVVAVYGVDGSGKSTVIDGLVKALGPAFAGTDRWHLFQFQEPGVAYDPVTEPHAQAPRSFMTSVAKLLWYLARAWLVRAPRIASATRRGYLVIIDRDVVDPTLDPVRYRFRVPTWMLATAARLLPRPTVALLLDADADTILKRSEEVAPDRLADLLRRYRRFARRHDWVIRVDASKPAEHVRAAAVAAVARHLALSDAGRGVPRGG